MPADPVRISQIAQAARVTVSEDVAVKTVSAAARERETATVLYNQADAAAENSRQFNLVKVRRDLYQVPLKDMMGVFSVGQTITLNYPRFGMVAGKNFMIIGISEQYGRGLTILTVWG